MDDPRCHCCDASLTTDGACPICDYAVLMSPPHVCLRTGRLITDEWGSEPAWSVLDSDHETATRAA